ncbi:hypothetical protein Acr_01g0010450 [Actinidia rufa]|uniref:Uncharacterized protein n=1 Tax=Actinidia rufa TaxID=165716 RepID=A0A7J0E4X4_9ERIC|nr:hypothetical protein Acr_01g0010450 [Actinidia rufa]
MSKRLKLSDLAKVVAQKAATSASKGVVISEGSETTFAPARPPIASGEGSSVKRTLGESLGPQASVMASAAIAEKILAGVILPADKEKVDRLTFDQVVTKFLHVLGQGVILGSSLAIHSRDFAECALNQKVVAESVEMEMVRAQNRAIELKGALAEEKANGKKLAEDADARDKVIARLEARISELEKSQSLTQGRIIAAFKESDDFLEAYPDLGIDLEDVEMDHEFLAQEEAETEKRAAEEGATGNRLSRRENGLMAGMAVFTSRKIGTLRDLGRWGRSITALPCEAREKNLLRGSPSNVKGWKTRFFFASGDEWEFPSGMATGKSCNKLPALSEVDAKRTKTIFGKIELGGYFEVSKVLDSRTFKKYFAVGCTALSSSGRDNTPSGDEGEFGTREDSVEYLGVIRRDIGGAIRRALPGIPDKTLLRWLGGKVKDSFMNLLYGKSSSSSDSGSDSVSDSELPPKLRSDGDHVTEKGEPDSSKGKEAAPHPPPKRFKSTRGAINARGRAVEAGTSSPGGDIGSESMMSNAFVARRLLTGVILASDKKEVDQLSENELVAKSFHALGQVVVFASSLALRSQEHLHDIDFHMARADSAELELVKAQKRAVKAKNRLVELSEEGVGSKPGTEVDDLKATVAELTNKLAKAEELAIEDFKASGEFKAAVTDSAATYFSEGFEFCKRQLLHQFPDLGVDVANMAMDPSFAEEEEAMKEGEDPVARVAPNESL